MLDLPEGLRQVAVALGVLFFGICLLMLSSLVLMKVFKEDQWLDLSR
jgi:hypothetical protein